MTGTLRLLALAALACQPGSTDPPSDAPDEQTAVAAEHVMSGSMAEDPHLRLTPLRAPAPGDSARFEAVLAQMRRDLDRYHDIREAKADGFRQYIPGGAAAVQHYTKIRWALRSRTELDPSRPSSLLYRRAQDGTLELVGAMFTAPADASDDELNARLPLSLARWHQHVNWCVPPLRRARERWRETRDGRPVFGPRSPIVTPEACAEVGGRFRPRLLGWMVHVEFAGAGGAHHH